MTFSSPRFLCKKIGFLSCLMLSSLSGWADNTQRSTQAAEIAILNAANWDEYIPAGKEVDAIYGDIVLRNDKITLVIAKPVDGRNANMTVRNTGGCIIDLTSHTDSNDQLSAFYPGGTGMNWRKSEFVPPLPQGADKVAANKVEVYVSEEKSPFSVRYILEEGNNWVLVESSFSNPGKQPLQIALTDQLRADQSFDKVPNGPTKLFWVHDKWWRQAYGILPNDIELESTSDARNSTLTYKPEGKDKAEVPAGGKFSFSRKIFPADDLIAVKALTARLQSLKTAPRRLEVRDTAGKPIAGAEVELRVKADDKEPYARGSTDNDGNLLMELPNGNFQALVKTVAHGQKTLPIDQNQVNKVELSQAGTVSAKIVGESGEGIACKVEFRGRGETKDPFFFHMSGEHKVHNLYYTHNGRFEVELAPGRYECIISHGPEFDAVFTEIEVSSGNTTPLAATLVQSVQTPGWISSDFHSHSTPSGDNTSSQLGRVLNLLCEHIEFAPCTEHNRLSTYVPHLEMLGVRARMATCTGIELTNNPGDVNHQNAFPFVLKPRTQNNGGPERDDDPEVQVERLAMWDGGSHKLIQQNHPDLGHVFYDKNGDGKPDGGFQKSLPHLDVIEVHPPQTIFAGPTTGSGAKPRNNTIFNWLQLLNQGYRIPGVVNTDAHYNFHGSGFLRIYLQSPTDHPSKVQTMDMVNAAEKGHIIMTNGPYLEVLLESNEQEKNSRGTAGDDIIAPSGKGTLHVRVQCANWLDIDRVQVLLNGRAIPELNFKRSTHSNKFAGGVVKFDQKISLDFKADTHVIVVAAGEGSTLGPVLGPDQGKTMPVAVSNPIYVDVDGGGFKANGDTLDAPLPVIAGAAK